MVRRLIEGTAVFAVLFTALAGAQTITGEISGTVMDESGAVVPGASVVLRNESTGARREAISNKVGLFVFPALPPGTYSVRVTSRGFRTFERTGVLLTANDRVSVPDLRFQSFGQVASTRFPRIMQAGLHLYF